MKVVEQYMVTYCGVIQQLVKTESGQYYMTTPKNFLNEFGWREVTEWEVKKLIKTK